MGREVEREEVYEEFVNPGMGWDELERKKTLQAQKEQSHRGEKQQVRGHMTRAWQGVWGSQRWGGLDLEKKTKDRWLNK